MPIIKVEKLSKTFKVKLKEKLDEPKIGLDPVVKENIRSLIKRMNKEYKTTIFLTSHDVGEILEIV